MAPLAVADEPAAAVPTPSRATPASHDHAQERRGQRSLLRANERRRQQRFPRRWPHQQVLGRYPGSDAAYVARVSAGMLYVERLRDPGARAAFSNRSQAAAAGSLSEEGRLGLADAWPLGNPLRSGQRCKPSCEITSGLARPQTERRLQPWRVARCGVKPRRRCAAGLRIWGWLAVLASPLGCVQDDVVAVRRQPTRSAPSPIRHSVPEAVPISAAQDSSVWRGLLAQLLPVGLCTCGEVGGAIW